MKRNLSEPQERNLMRFYLCGEFGEHRWPSIESLANEGMIKIGEKHFSMTDKGRLYCEMFLSPKVNP